MRYAICLVVLLAGCAYDLALDGSCGDTLAFRAEHFRAQPLARHNPASGLLYSNGPFRRTLPPAAHRLDRHADRSRQLRRPASYVDGVL